MITLELARKGSAKRARLRLPAEVGEVQAAFAQLDTPTGMTYIADSRSNIHNLHNYINNIDINDPEKFGLLQQIAERTEGLTGLKAKTFAGALDCNSINGPEDILKVADRLDEYTHIPDAYDHYHLGKHLVTTGMCRYPQEIWPYLNYETIGLEYYTNHGGAYTRDGYTIGRSEWEQSLDAEHPPIFRLYLQSKNCQDPYQLVLPASDEQGEYALRRLGVDHLLFNTKLVKVECLLPQLADLLPMEDTSIDLPELHLLAEDVCTMRQKDQLDRFLAVLAVERPGKMDDVLCLSGHIDNYELVPSDPQEYGEEMLKRQGVSRDTLADIYDYMDFAAYGAARMKEAGVRLTPFGAIYALDESFPPQEQEEGPQMGGLV